MLKTRSQTVLSAFAGALLALGVLLTACGGSPEPVGSVSVAPSDFDLPYGETRLLELKWQAKQSLEGAERQPLVFVHLLPEDGLDVMRTFDHQLPNTWLAGSDTSYTLKIHQSILGPPLAAGTYRLTAGLYDAENRWPLEISSDHEEDAGSEIGRFEYAVARVRIPAPQANSLPRFDYEGDWSPLITGQDRQILGWRFLGPSADLRVGEIPTTGTLGLDFEIPPTPPGVVRDLSPDADPGGVPALIWSAPCSGQQGVISGVGAAAISVPLKRGMECEIRLRPNFSHRLAPDAPAEGFDATELARLVGVTWTPSSAPGNGSGVEAPGDAASPEDADLG